MTVKEEDFVVEKLTRSETKFMETCRMKLSVVYYVSLYNE